MNHLFHEDHEDFINLFVGFEKSLQDTTHNLTLDEILDQLEINLDILLPFLYFQVHLYDNEDLTLKSSFTPDGTEADQSILNWVIENKEITVIEKSVGENSNDILYLPLLANCGAVGVVVLWIEFVAKHFTQGLSKQLMLLGQIVATRIESYNLRDKLENSQSQLTDIVESVGHGILAIDGNGKIILVNGTMEMMFRLERSKVLGKYYKDALSKDFSDVIVAAIKEKNSADPELSMMLLGSSVTIGVTASDIRDSSTEDSDGYVILCRDLSVTLELSKMREVDMMKNDFLSLVSHELRTPLTSILAYTEALMIDGMVEGEEDRKEYLEVIYNEGERLTRLINDVLDLTKMESGKMDYHYITCNLDDIINSSITYSKVSAKNAKISLVFKNSGPSPLPVYCDVDRITQVLLNMLSNAIKFTPEGGKISISLETKETENGDVAQVTVTDTGIGIAPEDLNKVFSRFEQIESLAHHSRGTGLGMPICKKIIEQGHRGTIGLNSKFGVGSTFFFTIPLDSNEGQK